MMPTIASLIERVLNDPENEENIATVRSEVNALMADYPLYAW
jgi:glycine hydroxymethyltransferase